MNRNLGILAATLLVVTAAACTNGERGETEPGDDSSASASSEPAATAPVRALWRRELDLIGQPEVVDGVAVALALVRGDELDVVALDVRTGKVRWRRPYSPGNVSPGYGLEPLVTEDDRGRAHVMFQRPGKGLTGATGHAWPLVAVRLRSGAEVYRTGATTVDTPLDSCSDGTDACVFQPGAGGFMSRYDLDGINLRFRGKDIPMGDNEGRPPGAQDIGGGGLYTTDDGRRIGRVREGRQLWERPAEAIFGAGRTTEVGWSIYTRVHPTRYTGSIGKFWTDEQSVDYQAGRPIETSLAREQLVRFLAADGSVEWSRPGVLDCVPDADVRCRIAGVAVHELGRADRFRVRRAWLEGYDKTGRTTWRVRLSEAWTRRYLSQEPVVGAARGTTVMGTAEGPRVIDLSDGSTSPVEDGRVFLCEGATRTFQYAVAWGDSFTRAGDSLSYVCDASGRPRPGPLTVEAVDHGGVRAGDLRLVATERGLTAYDVGE